MKKNKRDLHILRYFSSLVSVSNGKVVKVTSPALSFCPLASHLYKGLRKVDRADKKAVKLEIKKAIESKIRDFGFFTSSRVFSEDKRAVQYGASEMLAAALKRKAIDAAVVVCDGAGTVITDNGNIVQGIGARMNTLVRTSPIPETISLLSRSSCHMVSELALIDQLRGVKKAIASGYKRIAVTVSGHDSSILKKIRSLECDGIDVIILSVCTTGISAFQAGQIKRYADIVWSCASNKVREYIGRAAILQVSKQIPVFVMTGKGVEFIASYAEDSAMIRSLSRNRQHLISNEPGGRKVRLGGVTVHIREERLPFLFGKKFLTLDGTGG